MSKRIFILIGAINAGGAERVTNVLANQWAKDGNEVFVISSVEGNRGIFKWHSDVRFLCLNFKSSRGLKKIYEQIKCIFRLRKLIRDYKPDAVLSLLVQNNLMNIVANIGLPGRVFISDRNNPYKTDGALFDFLRKHLYRKADGIIAQTSEARLVLTALTRNDNIRTIPNPINASDFVWARGMTEEPLIINVGRLVPQKGQKLLIEAFVQIAEKHLDWNLMIVGDGPDLNALNEMILSRGMSDRILIHPPVNNIDELVGRAGIFVFSSLSEGFPNALAEAMVMGRACISFDCDTGPRDIIKNNVNGILIPAKDVVGLSAAMDYLISTPEVRHRLAESAENLKDRLACKVIADKYFEFIFS